MKFSHLSRLYSNSTIVQNQVLKIEGEDFFYLKSVMRLRQNDIFRIFNEINGEFLVKIESIDKHNINILPFEQIRIPLQEKELILGICLIKPDRMTEAIIASIQLGVTKIIPLISERTQYKTINYQKISKCIIQAIEQCERFKPPYLLREMQLTDFCKLDNIDQIIFACESEDVAYKINNIDEIKQNVAVLIGPEGGFSEKETAFIKSISHVNSVSLGSTVLRAETAAITAIACVQMVRT